MSIVKKTSNSKMLIPQPGINYVRRERLTDILHNNIQKRLQIISAPAGYGKTTLLADFIISVDVPVCWYSINTEDEDPGLLLEGILSSISSCFSAFGRLTLSRLAVTDDIMKNAPHLLTILANELNNAVPDYFILVIEDYHVIEHSEPAKMILNLLLEKIPENCHVIISSRTQVELPIISKLILRNQVSVLTISHLSFTAAETKCLATTCFDQDLTNEDADKLVLETGGWAVSLILHLNKLGPNGFPKLPEITQDRVFDYVTTEIYEKQSTEIQYFLLASSTVDDIESELIEQLIPGINYYKLMDYLTRQNLFLQCIDEKAKRYRYHQLLRDFLQEKLKRDDPVQFKILHFKAALFYEREHRLIESVAHYHRANKYREIARIIRDTGSDLSKAGKWAILEKWLNTLPINLRASEPKLILLDVQCLSHLGNTEKAQKLLAKLLDKPLSDEDWIIKAEALSWRGAVSRLSGYFREAKNDLSAAIRLLEEHHGPAELLGTCHRRLGDIYKDQSQYFSALKHLRLAQRCYTSVFDISSLATVHNSLGVVHKRLGQLTKAKMYFEKARVGWIKVDNGGELAITLNNIGIIYQRLGQYDLALDTFILGLEKSRQTGYMRIEAVITISIADVLRDMSRYDEALKAYDEGIKLARQSLEATFIAYANAGIGETYRLLKQYDRARTVLEEARHQAEDQEQPYETALFDIQLGIIDYETGRLELAKGRLQDAGKRLKAIGDLDALAKVYFHLAQVSFLERDFKSATEWLEKTNSLANDLGYENFLVIEGKRALPLIHFGISHSIGNGRLIRVIEKIKAVNEMERARNNSGAPMEQHAKNEYDIEVHTLGRTEVIVNNIPVKDIDWRSSRAKEIFFYLLGYPKGKTKEQIITALWPDVSPAKGSSNFHINLFRARHALFPGVFTLDDGKYRISSDLRIWFDVAEFEKLISVASTHSDAGKKFSILERAEELYAGTFLIEFYTEWIEIRRRELENVYLKVLSLLADFHAERGNIERAVALLEKYISIDPYQENAYYRIMRIYLQVENVPLAVRVYKQYLDISKNDNELTTSPEMRDLYHKLVIGEIPSKN